MGVLTKKIDLKLNIAPIVNVKFDLINTEMMR